MSIKITNYLVLDSNTEISSLKVSRHTHGYTEQGTVLYPIKNVIPVIVRGKGCVGTALVKTVIMREETTTVEFEFTKVDPVTAKVLYNMYMNNSSMVNNSDDVYSNDVSIPGAINAPKVNLADKLESNKRQIMDDIFGTVNGKKRSRYDDDDDF